MAKTVLMPQIGITVETCIIGSWKKKVGDKVAVGDVLFDYETDKTEVDCESTEAGTILAIYYQDGDEVPVLVPVCAIGEPGEDISGLDPNGAAAPAAEAPAAAPAAAAAPAPAAPTGPVAKTVLMPQVGITVESCIIGSWKKNVGDQVAVGDILFDYETDKTEVDCESTAEGTLLEIFYQNGDEVPVLVPVCAIGNPGDDVASLRPAGAAAPAAEAPAAAAAPAAAPAAQAPAAAVTASADGRIFISPRAKALAEKQNVDIRMAQPTGPNGRIIERDIRTAMDHGFFATGAAAGDAAAAAAGSISGTGIGGRVSVADLNAPAAPAAEAAPAAPAAPAAEYEDVKFSRMRIAIAKNMVKSLSTIPQLTNNISFDATGIKKLRAQFKNSDESLGLNKITIGDMVMYAVSRILLKYPDFNAVIQEENVVRHFNSVNLGFACDTEKGLLVPVVKNAEKLSLLEMSAEIKRLSKLARDGKLGGADMSGGTFTVSNVGAFGIESFTPVINPPQTAILGVASMVDRPRMKDGQITLYPAMGLSLTYDHRLIDGGPAARFGQELCKMLENFNILLAK